MNFPARFLLLSLYLLGMCAARAQQAPGTAGFSCGLNAAYIFLNRAGHHVGYDELVTEFTAQKPPDSLLAIKQVLEKHGCKTIGIKTGPEYFLDNKGPAIVFLQLTGYSVLNEKHFSYLVNASRQDGVKLLDPIFDLTSASFISWDAFTRTYQGMALIPE